MATYYPCRGLGPRLSVYKTDALPVELTRHTGSTSGLRAHVTALKGRRPHILDDSAMAGENGIEPLFTDSKSAVRPLYDSPIRVRE